MKLSEAIEIVEHQATDHRVAAWAPKEPITKHKEWVKTITALNKSISTGYSLVGEFWDKNKDLEPGLFLIFTLFIGRRILKKQVPQLDGSYQFLKNENDEIIYKTKDCYEYFEERRALLFDFDGNRAKLEHFAWLPRKSWAKQLWFPVENWLEIQPNIQTKIKFWEAEIKLRSEALCQAQQRLNALKQQIFSDAEELDPQTKEWLQTAAVLGNTKKVTTTEATLTKTVKTFL
jgi:hypothetical protein